MNLFVAGLPYDLDDAELMEIFEKFGTVTSAKVAMDKETGKSRGFAFVEMPNEEEAKDAIENLNDISLGKKPLVVKQAEERSSGGGGGFKGGNRGPGGGGGRPGGGGHDDGGLVSEARGQHRVVARCYHHDHVVGPGVVDGTAEAAAEGGLEGASAERQVDHVGAVVAHHPRHRRNGRLGAAAFD